MTGQTKETKSEQRVRIARLIPPEILFASVVFLTLGCTIAIWTGRIVMRDAATRYENEALWPTQSPAPKEQADFIEQERKRRQDLLAAAQKTGPGYTNALIALGNIYQANGKWELAAGCFDNALKSLGKDGSDKQTLASIYFALGHADFQLGKIDQSIHWLLKAKGVGASDNTKESLSPHILEELTLAYCASDNLVAAKRTCVALLDKVGGSNPDDPRLVAWKCQLADLERRMKDDVGAERLFREALIDLASRSGDAGADIARARFGLALSCAQQGAEDEASRNYKLALAQAQKSDGPHSPLVQAIRHTYAYSLWKTNWIAALAMTFSSDSH